MSDEGNESYYKILGTTAKIGNARIKEKYVKALKEHPPETDPEGFEKVRRAYETLKDPENRKRYDLTRKYGANVEKLIEEASHSIATGDFEKADKLLGKASEISSDNPSVLISLMMLAIENGNLEEMDRLFEKVLRIIQVSGTEEILGLYSIKVNALAQHAYYDEALDVIKQVKVKYPNDFIINGTLFASIYMQAGHTDEAWEMINATIPSPEKETFDDIYIFMTWSNIMMELEKWEAKSKVQSRFRKFIKKLIDEEEKDMAYDLLDHQFQEVFDDGQLFRSAEFYIDLLRVLDNTDSELKERQNETKKLARIEKEIERLQKDDDAFPLLFLHAFEWFYEGIIPLEHISMILNSIPPDIIAELKQEKEVYAAGILRISKRYPSLYKHFKASWDNLFDELTQGFNREMRRDLRRVK